MKVVTGLFTPENSVSVIRALLNNGYCREDLSIMSTAAQVPDYLAGEPEEAAVHGAALGAVAGGATGALGAVAASGIPGLENVLVSGLMATSIGSVIGAYLGSLYSVRAESQTEIDVHEELGEGKILILARLRNEVDETAVSLMEEKGGEHIEVHQVAAS